MMGADVSQLHAHLSGSISPECLHDMWKNKTDERAADIAELDDPLIVMRPTEFFDLAT